MRDLSVLCLYCYEVDDLTVALCLVLTIILWPKINMCVSSDTPKILGSVERENLFFLRSDCQTFFPTEATGVDYGVFYALWIIKPQF